MNDNYKKRLSDAITWLRFPLIFCIILLHCYSVQRLEGSHETYFIILYPFSLWPGETRHPAFFFIFSKKQELFAKEKNKSIHTPMSNCSTLAVLDSVITNKKIPIYYPLTTRNNILLLKV